MATNWQEIATKLYEGLRSFTAYDGYGHGGAADANRGDWPTAEKALLAYDYALRTMEIPSDESKRRRFDAGVEDVHMQMLAEKQRDEISPGGSFPAHRINDRSPWERPD